MNETICLGRQVSDNSKDSKQCHLGIFTVQQLPDYPLGNFWT